ncbi:hypothetical protein B0H17DRAFT_1179964 [Mycena rosella]|uniref:Uncharacterized protein n=1 Tax=Mycena rosella TaxID=1033263 RepID=A0AAD7GE64_MYCRO|nr:hypothetical protein B0H17DRAFT_1179964 [Mycena rosella]
MALALPAHRPATTVSLDVNAQRCRRPGGPHGGALPERRQVPPLQRGGAHLEAVHDGGADEADVLQLRLIGAPRRGLHRAVDARAQAPVGAQGSVRERGAPRLRLTSAPTGLSCGMRPPFGSYAWDLRDAVDRPGYHARVDARTLFYIGQNTSERDAGAPRALSFASSSRLRGTLHLRRVLVESPPSLRILQLLVAVETPSSVSARPRAPSSISDPRDFVLRGAQFRPRGIESYFAMVGVVLRADGQRPRAAARKTLKLQVQALLRRMHFEECVMAQTRRCRLLYQHCSKIWASRAAEACEKYAV